MRALVTGGTGFIGSHLVDRLVKDGHSVVVPVRKSSDRKYLSSEGADIREADLLDGAATGALMKNVDIVFHLAAIRGSGWTHDDTQIRRVNVELTRNLLDRSARGNVSRFIYISSVSVFGHPYGGPVAEDSPCFPATRYGKTKYDSEALVTEFHRNRNVPGIVIRPVITYGPRDTWGMIPKLVRLIDSGRYLTVGSGENRVHLLYIDDLIEGIMRSVDSPAAPGSTYVFSGMEPVTVNRLVDLISSALGKRVPPFHVPLKAVRIAGHLLETAHRVLGLDREPFLTPDKIDIMCRDRFFSHERARDELGFDPRTDCGTGIGITVKWLNAA
ncbi:MAG: NAD(P)-dependent oxidoreductase [Deltaproteobacteria bacterium]|nr:NAD(P)-dependent oxidoreductase [Deltaproteobacteria bacterium]